MESEKIVPANKFLFGVRGDELMHMIPIPVNLSKQDALLMAAWLVVLADDEDEFPKYLEAVKNT